MVAAQLWRKKAQNSLVCYSHLKLMGGLPDLSASAPAIISLRSFEIWLVVKADCRDPSDSEVSGLCFDFFLILNVLLEN